jgi:hypothetical protein
VTGSDRMGRRVKRADSGGNQGCWQIRNDYANPVAASELPFQNPRSATRVQRFVRSFSSLVGFRNLEFEKTSRTADGEIANGDACTQTSTQSVWALTIA